MNQLTKEQRDRNVRYLLEKTTPYTFEDLVTVVELLRSEGGCPWDMEQTHKSIRNDFIEETYEVIEAIDILKKAALAMVHDIQQSDAKQPKLLMKDLFEL